MLNPLNSTYLGRWLVRAHVTQALRIWLALNPWVLLFECEAVTLSNDAPMCICDPQDEEPCDSCQNWSRKAPFA